MWWSQWSQWSQWSASLLRFKAFTHPVLSLYSEAAAAVWRAIAARSVGAGIRFPKCSGLPADSSAAAAPPEAPLLPSSHHRSFPRRLLPVTSSTFCPAPAPSPFRSSSSTSSSADESQRCRSAGREALRRPLRLQRGVPLRRAVAVPARRLSLPVPGALFLLRPALLPLRTAGAEAAVGGPQGGAGTAVAAAPDLQPRPRVAAECRLFPGGRSVSWP